MLADLWKAAHFELMRPVLYLARVLFVALGLVGSSVLAQSNGQIADSSCSASVVLIGRVSEADYKDQFDVFNTICDLHIHVKKVFRGSAISQNIIAISVSEAQIRSGTDFVFFLSRGRDEQFGVLGFDMDVARGRAKLKSCKFPQPRPK